MRRTSLRHTDVPALFRGGEPVGTTLAASVRELLAAARGGVVVELGRERVTGPWVHGVPAYIWHNKFMKSLKIFIPTKILPVECCLEGSQW